MTEKRYSTILLAVDFTDSSQSVIAVGQDLAERYSAELHIVYVNEPFPTAYAADGMGWNSNIYSLEAEILEADKKRLSQLALDLGITEANCHFLKGRPASQIHELSAQLDVDLIVIGTHGQAGLQLLLGSTASSVLHGASCDVLAVRIKE
ncbi:MAG: universal stress protein A [Candidatus Azotimanducaceae bacterium]|jgi:universal stress protein A